MLRENNLARFVRLDYDLETTIRKILADPDLDDIHGPRLRSGY